MWLIFFILEYQVSGGGVNPVGTKYQLFPKINFSGSTKGKGQKKAEKTNKGLSMYACKAKTNIC